MLEIYKVYYEISLFYNYNKKKMCCQVVITLWERWYEYIT